MLIDFFEKELMKAQKRFNQTFGVLNVCDLKTRQVAILKIIQMGRLRDVIMQSNNNDEVMEERSKFVKARNWLNNIFSQIEDELKERRRDANKRNQSKVIHLEQKLYNEEIEVCPNCGNIYKIYHLKEGDDWNDFGTRHCPYCGLIMDEYAHVGKK